MRTKIKDGLLWIGAILGSLCLVWTLVMVGFGLTPLVFTSGSMAPEIGVGDLAFARTVDASLIQTGDVVSVDNAEGKRVTHRVEDVVSGGEGVVLTLKGDANAAVDDERYVVTEAERVVFSIPKLGYLITWVSSGPGMFLGGMLAMVALTVAFRVRRDDDGDDSPGTQPLRDVAVAALACILAGVGATVAPEQTLAAFTDTATATSGGLSSATVATPSVTCVVGGGLFQQDPVDLSWTKTSALYEFTWQLIRESTSSVVQSGTVGADVANGGTVTHPITPSGLANGAYRFEVRARLKVAPSWTSSVASRVLNRSTTLFFPNMSCG